MNAQAPMSQRPAVCAYVRVSSRAQNYATQRDAIERTARARGDKVFEWYREKQSGKRLKRPVLGQLRSDARSGKLSRIYLYKLDRLTRSGIADTLTVIEELKRYGCEIITVADGFDLDGPAAEIILAVMAWSAKMERLAIGERISAARERVEAEGGRWGRPRRMDDLQIQRAQDLRANGLSLRAISAALKVPYSTVQRALAAIQKPPPQATV